MKKRTLCAQIRKQKASEIDHNESYFSIDSKPIDVCRIARAKRCIMGKIIMKKLQILDIALLKRNTIMVINYTHCAV